MTLLYLGESGSKLPSVNTQTIQFSPFLDSRSLEKTCIYIYICIWICICICILHIHMYVGVNYFQPFPHILWVAQLSMGFHVAPKTPVGARNAMFFPPNIFLCSISAPDFCKKRDIYIYAYLFKPFSKKTLFLGAPLPFDMLPSILVYAGGSKFQCVNTQTIQLSPFLDSRSLRKYVYIFKQIYLYICIYVHMYITFTYVYYMYICM